VIAFVDRMLQRVVDLANGGLDNGAPQTFAGYCSMRYTASTFAWLGMQMFNPTVAFEIAGLGRVHGTEPFLRTIEADAVEFNAAIHWGQRNNQEMKAIERVWDPNGPFGNLFLWRTALSNLSENGRWPTFSTDFTRARGLEVVQPVLVAFTVSLTEAAAGESTRVAWDAVNNPPKTLISLFVHPAGSTPAGPAVFETSDLMGFRDVTVPAGQWSFTLVASLDVNGRELTDPRTLEVRGFADHGVSTFDIEAGCMLVDGVMRWAVPLTLLSRFISNNLLVESLTGTTGTFSKWHARLAGHPDVVLGPASPSHIFAVPPIFNSDWLFFLTTPGCTGAPPLFHLDFKLIRGV
jgi:hypothetical protein